MKNNTFEEIWSELKKAKKVLMTLHYRPDGDSLGSCAAMKYVLEKEGVDVTLISKDKLNEGLSDFEFSKEVEFGRDIQKENLGDFDKIVFLDYGAADSDFSEEFMKGLKSFNVINIDHHKTNSYFGSLNYVNEKSASTCSVLFEMFKKIGIKFDREISLRLLVGICTDTGFFKWGDSIDSMKKATTLLETGKIDYEKEVYDVIMTNPWKLKKLHGIILNNMEKEEIRGTDVAYSWSTKEDYKKAGLDESDVRLAVICMNDIKDIDLVFVLNEIDGTIKGSFRSSKFDTTLYSSVLGGGGHKAASGFTIKGSNMKDAIKKVLETIKEKGFVPVN